MLKLDVIAHYHPWRAKPLRLKAGSCLLGMSILFFWPTAATAMVALGVSLWCMSRCHFFKWTTFFRWFLGMGLVLGLSALSLLVTIDGLSTGLPFVIMGIDWHQGGRALETFLRSFGCGHILMAYAYMAPMPQTLKGLSKLGIPKTLLSIFEISYRFIFILIDEASAIHHAQTLRLGHRGTMRSLKSLGQLSGALLSRVVAKAHQQYVSSLLRLGD